MKKFIFSPTTVLLAILTSCTDHKHPDLGEGFRLVSDGKYSLEIVDVQNNVVVATHILNYAFDSTFIIASQRPWVFPGIPKIEDMTYNQQNEAFEKSEFRQYWIVNKREKGEYRLDTLTRLARYSNVYGPFDMQKYLQKREELEIPNELKLNE